MEEDIFEKIYFNFRDAINNEKKFIGGFQNYLMIFFERKLWKMKKVPNLYISDEISITVQCKE